MLETHVYCTTNVDNAVDLKLTPLGPNEIGEIKNINSVPKRISDLDIMQIPRTLDSAMYLYDLALSVDGTYIVSLQLMLRGHGLGSMIWWRWRAASPQVGQWYTSSIDHNTQVSAGGHTYSFHVRGKSANGYNDVYIALTPGLV